MKKNVTLIDGGDNIKKFLKSLARSILIVAGIAIITMGVSEVSFRRIEKIEEENCWQVLGDAAQAVNNEIVIRMEENINTLHLVSEIMTGEDIVYSYRRNPRGFSHIRGNNGKLLDTYWVMELMLRDMEKLSISRGQSIYEQYLKSILKIFSIVM